MSPTAQPTTAKPQANRSPDAQRRRADQPHADKYNDPRVQITGRGIAMGVAIVLSATVVALASIAARRTVSIQTTSFYGSQTIQALQLGDHVTMRSIEPAGKSINLSGAPGLGHLRKALLDDQHYDWSGGAAVDAGDREITEDAPRVVELQFSDPTLGRFRPATIRLDLDRGEVRLPGTDQTAQLNDRVRPAMKHQLTLLMRFTQDRYDVRGEG